MVKSIILHCITPEELRQIIKEVIKEELLEVRKQLEKKDSEGLLSRKETCEFLKLASQLFGIGQIKGKLIVTVLEIECITRKLTCLIVRCH